MGLGTDGLVWGWEEGPVGSGGSSCLLPASDLLLHSPGAHCPLFLRDTNYSLAGS